MKMKSEVLKSMNKFAFKQYQSLSSSIDKNENILFSPASIYAALSMVYCGARGSTAEEMKRVLECSGNDDEFHETFCKIWDGILKANANKDVCLEIANRLWIQDGKPVEKKFQEHLLKNYKADAATVDFKNKTESAKQEINKWVEENTKHKIKDVIQELSPETMVSLTNALYFYGQWNTEYELKDTKPMPFHAPDGVITVDMMYQKDRYGYMSNKYYDCRLLTSPYKHSSLHCLIALPNKVDGIDDLERKLLKEGFYGEEIWEWVDTRYREVCVYLPKFRISQKTKLSKSLKDIGMNEIFTDNADLTGISELGYLRLSDVTHATYMDFNEKGTEVVAFTGCDVVRACGGPPHLFKADHPFLIFIVDKDTETILFWGRVCKPSYE